MTLSETIEYYEEKAEAEERNAKLHQRPDKDVKGSGRRYLSCLKCAKAYRRHAEWLKELQYYKDRQDLINKSWQELINYKEGIEKIKIRSQAYRECGETILANGMEQALDILEEVNANGK